MNAPNSVTTVMVNENLKKIVQPKKRKYTFLSYFACAAVAGSFASVVTCPMDNIKTKLQTQNTTSTCEKLDTLIKDFERDHKNSKMTFNELRNKFQASTFSTNTKTDCNTEPEIKYKNIFSTVKMVWREDGLIRGFYRGLTPRIMGNAPSCAITWGTYEMVKHFLTNKK
jgi:hypothetical protein